MTQARPDLLERLAAMLESADSTTYPTPGAMAKAIDHNTRQTPALELIDQALVDVDAGRCERLIISMPPQEGKALALDTPVPTPAGWTTMGALQIGDVVFDREGNCCRVTWVSQVWRDRPCFTIRTGDGEAIIADADHEWLARLDRRSSERLHTSAALARQRTKNAQITAAPGLNLPPVEVPIDPYVLGAWLGDGTTRAASMTLHPDDVEIRDRFAAAGWPLRAGTGRLHWTMSPERWAQTGPRTGRQGKPSPARQALVAAGVWGNKHIPPMYLRASKDQRLALLQGLIDTDGYVDPGKGIVEFCTTLPALADDVRELVYTLGAKATVREARATINGRDCGPKYRVCFMLRDAAWLTRKAERCRDSTVGRVRYVWAEPTEPRDTVCIEVDSPTHTYLAGRTMLPTHNSERVTHYGALWMIHQNPSRRLGIVSYGEDVATRMSYAIRNDIISNDGTEGTLDLSLRLRKDSKAASRWYLDGHRGGVYGIGIGGALTGRPIDVLFIDDPVKDYRAAESTLQSELAWQWWQSVARPRLAPGAPVIVIMTRWHEQDLAGRMLAKQAEDEKSELENFDRWRVINIPAQADHRPEQGETDPLGRRPGEFMISARGRTAAQWQATKAATNARIWSALYQGKPSPEEGDLFKRTAWRRYDIPKAILRGDGTMHCPGADEVIQSWDMAFKDRNSSDFVVGQVWARFGLDVFLLDQVHARLSFTATCAELVRLSARWPQALAKLVEDKANGTAVIDQLKGTVPGLIPINPGMDSKYARALAVTPFVEAGQVWLPADNLASWALGFIDEAAKFPNSSHDDQVDGFTQALRRLLGGNRGPASVASPVGRYSNASRMPAVPVRMPR